MLALPVALDPLRLRRAAAAHGVVVEDVAERVHAPSPPRPPTRLVLGYGRVPTAGVDAAVAGLGGGAARRGRVAAHEAHRAPAPSTAGIEGAGPMAQRRGSAGAVNGGR